MKVLSYAKACDVVDYYNASYCTRLVASQVKLPRQTVYEIVDWLFNREYLREVDLASTSTSKKLLPELTKERWCEYLYSHGVSPEAAARSLLWDIARVLKSCCGPTEWRKTSNRQLCFRKRLEKATSRGPDEVDPSEEEIARAAAAVRETWSESRFGVVERAAVREWHDTRQ